MSKDSWLYLRLRVRSPLKVAAWAPSGLAVARAFARHIDLALQRPGARARRRQRQPDRRVALATGLPPVAGGGREDPNSASCCASAFPASRCWRATSPRSA